MRLQAEAADRRASTDADAKNKVSRQSLCSSQLSTPLHRRAHMAMLLSGCLLNGAPHEHSIAYDLRDFHTLCRFLCSCSGATNCKGQHHAPGTGGFATAGCALKDHCPWDRDARLLACACLDSRMHLRVLHCQQQVVLNLLLLLLIPCASSEELRPGSTNSTILVGCCSSRPA